MSKITPLPRIDRDYEKNLRFPDINDFLKDTSYWESTSALADNQSHVVLRPRVSNTTTPIVMPNFIVDGVKRTFYMTPVEFYGYNPDLESVERAEISVDFLQVPSSKKQTIYRGGNDDSIVTLPGQQANANGENLYNYKVRLSVATIESILTWVFNTNKEQAKAYFAGDYLTLQNFVDTQFYTMSIPINIKMYYFNATDAAIIYKTSLEFGSLTTVLKSSLVVKSASVYPYVYTGQTVPTRPLSNYLTVKAVFAAPITTNALWLTATLSGTGTNATEQAYVENGNLLSNTNLLRKPVSKAAHASYSVTYPTVDFAYSATSEAFTGNASISGLALGQFTPTRFLPVVHPLTITNYFIGHPTDELQMLKPTVVTESKVFYVKVTFSVAKNVISPGQEKTFMLEFIKPDNPKTETFDAVGVVSTTVRKDKLVVRGSIPMADYSVNKTAAYESSYLAASTPSGYLYRSAYFDESAGVYNSTVQKIFNEARNESAYAHPNLSTFISTLTYVPSSSTTTDTYTLSVQWVDPDLGPGLFLTAELPIIRLSLGNFMYQFYAQGMFTKLTADNYTRAENPFYHYNNKERTLRWSPRIANILVNNLPLTGAVIGGVTALDATTVIVQPTTTFYKLPTATSVVLDLPLTAASVYITYVMRLYCRGYFKNPLYLLQTAPILIRDAQGFKKGYRTLSTGLGDVNVHITKSSLYTTAISKRVLDNVNVGLAKSPRSYFLTNLRLVTLPDKSTYYTYAWSEFFTAGGATNYTPRCEIGFYHDKI